MFGGVCWKVIGSTEKFGITKKLILFWTIAGLKKGEYGKYQRIFHKDRAEREQNLRLLVVSELRGNPTHDLSNQYPRSLRHQEAQSKAK